MKGGAAHCAASCECSARQVPGVAWVIFRALQGLLHCVPLG